jgi:hypothetical protein
MAPRLKNSTFSQFCSFFFISGFFLSLRVVNADEDHEFLFQPKSHNESLFSDYADLPDDSTERLLKEEKELDEQLKNSDNDKYVLISTKNVPDPLWYEDDTADDGISMNWTLDVETFACPTGHQKLTTSASGTLSLSVLCIPFQGINLRSATIGYVIF